MFKTHRLSSLKAHIFAVCKDNLFKFFSNCSHKLGLSFSVKIPLLNFIAIRSLLSDLGPILCNTDPSIFRESIGLCFGFKILIIRNAMTV